MTHPLHAILPLAGLLLLGTASCMPSRGEARAGSPPLWAADHHMHLATADLCRRIGECAAYRDPTAVLAEDAVRALDAAGVARGVALSSAYLYGLPGLALPGDSVAFLVRRENEFTAAEVARYPERLVAFLSVDPLEPSALEEIAHWRGNPGFRGLKLHLTALGVDLHDASHRARVGQVVAAAASAGLPIVVHVGGGRFGGEEAELFIREVLPRAGRSVVQVAHGAGGLPLVGDNHEAVLRTFADHITRGTPAVARVLFDLSFFPAPGEDSATVARLMTEVRRIGVGRFVFASDFDVQTPADAIRELDKLGLTAEEWEVVRRGCAPWVCAEAKTR
jgi:predicted TIM-barrel fold metal-dependent hydrolase